MERQALLTADYLDIVFDNRNKHYGGYELRKHYEQRMKKALLSVALLCGVASALITGSNYGETEALPVIPPPVILTHFDGPVIPPVPQSMTPSPPPADVATAEFAQPIIVKDEDPEAGVASKEELVDKKIGSENIEGAATKTDIGGPSTLPITGTISGERVATTSVTGPVRYVEQMPTFDGELNKYLMTNLRYPALARENNIEGKVAVEFIVNEDGTISNAVVKKGIGGGCDEEALRVVKSMPKWKAGRQNGKTVKVYLLLPIVFRLQ